VAPHEDQEDSQSYYFEHSDEDGEELKEAYKVLYVEFLKLRETRKLLETQLQLERVTDEKLTHMLSI
jgi:hypothetical protein